MELGLHSDFKDFLKLLNSEKVEYLVVGGYAVGYHGYVRTTGDLDIWIAVNPENAARVAAALRGFGFGGVADPAIFLQKPKIFRMGVQPVRIELLTGISGIEFADAYSRRVVGTIDDVELNLIGLHDLKVNKKASGRHKDLADLDELEELERRNKQGK